MDREKKIGNNLLKITQEINLLEYLSSFINTLPFLVVILNDDRKILYSNNKVTEILDVNDLTEFLGKKPGEALECIYSYECEDGCGSSEHCK
ncbi:MAG: PAS domain-containing protein [Bacteroidales bacterium]